MADLLLSCELSEAPCPSWDRGKTGRSAPRWPPRRHAGRKRRPKGVRLENPEIKPSAFAEIKSHVKKVDRNSNSQANYEKQ